MKKRHKRLKYLLIISFSILLTSCGSGKKETVSNSLSVMSFNIRFDNPEDGENQWVNRKEACVKMIKANRPDVFGLQEALENQIEYLKASLPEYQVEGKGRDPESHKNEHCAIFFSKDKFELLNSDTFWLSETPDVPSNGWDARYHRIATWVHLKDKQTQRELLYLNTHFDHKGQIARTESSKLLVESLKRLGHDTIPVLASGDFNALPQDSLFIPLKEYLTDIRLTVAPNDSMQTTNGWGSEPPSKIIDYIFFRNIEPVSYRVVTDNYGVAYVSDHYPIMGTFKY